MSRFGQAIGGVVEVNLGSTPRSSGVFEIPWPSRTTRMLVHQAAGPYTGKGTLADEAEMDAVTVMVTQNRFRAVCHWKSSGAVVGNFKFNWLAT